MSDDEIILPVMIGTAGHVDHGKTALVELLTGCDTDRLCEEKRRGLTIDLGFAPCRFPGRRLAGIVDVPGHRDFIRNMAAGAASIDILLLVVAADDGIMPQTREHLDIVRLLRTPQVCAAITKIDLVEDELADLVEEELTALLTASGFPDAPMARVSNQTGEGIPAVRTMLEKLIDASPVPEDPRAFRMYVERRFSVPGHGTVVTGVPVCGELRVGDAVELRPAGTHHTVRGIQSYKLDREIAVPRICAAINLRDLDANAVGRGMCLAAPGFYPEDRDFAVELENARPQPIRRLEGLRLHSGTASVPARLRLLRDRPLDPGERAPARLALARPLPLAAGDRFVLRSTAPEETVAGGSILGATGERIRHGQAGVAARMNAAVMAGRNGDHFTAALLVGREPIVTTAEARRLSQVPAGGADAAVERAVEAGTLIPLGAGRLAVVLRREEIARRLVHGLTAYHRDHPRSWGAGADEACRACDLPPRCFRGLMDLIADEPRFRVRHGRLALTEHEPALSAKQAGAFGRLARLVAEAGVCAMAPANLRRDLDVPAKDVEVLSDLLVEEGRAVRVGKHLFDRAAHDEIREALLACFHAHDRLDLARFRAATGLSRNLAVAVLESFDKAGLTRRDGDERVLA